MDQLQAMRVFTQIIDAGSFVKAAHALDLSTPVVTRHVADLERHLGVRLLHRTTRNLQITEAGQAYLERCRQILHDVAEADGQATSCHAKVSGTLRITSPITFGAEMLPGILALFHNQHPEVKIEIALTDRAVDLVEENIDLIIQTDQMNVAADHVVRPLLISATWLCASPEYLAKHPAPLTPESIADHNCISYVQHEGRKEWLVTNGSEKRRIPIRYITASNNIEMMRRLTLEGMGIAPLSDYAVTDDLRAGRLVRVLPEWALPSLTFLVAYPSRRYLPAKTRSFLDFLLLMAQRKTAL